MKKFLLKIKWHVQLVRWPNLLIIALTQYFVRYNLIRPVYESHNCSLQISHLNFAFLVLSTLLVVAGGYIINDYFDLRIDVVNKPEKMMLFKRIRLRPAIRLYYILTVMGCLCGIYVAFTVGYIMLGFVPVIMSIALWFYSLKYKRIAFAGNLTVAILVGVSLGMIWLFEFFALKLNPPMFANLVGNFGLINLFILGYIILAFLITMIREMVKDIEDIEGDRSFHCRTLPIVSGIPAMHRIIVIITLIAIGFTGYVSYKLFKMHEMIAAWYFIIAIGLLWLYFFMMLLRAKGKKDYHFLSNILKIIMVAGILSMQLLHPGI
jgi:4-hydroxybenzoate polyprenyltransferase